MDTTTLENKADNDTKGLTLTGAAILAAIIMVGIAGCSTGTETTVKTNAYGPSPHASADNRANNAAVVSEEVPTALTAAGEFGENIYDAVKANDWKTANAKLTELKVDAEKMTALKIGSAGFEATLAKLEKTIASKNKTSSLVEANQLTLEAANLTAKYNPAVPVEIVKLDFYGRELDIWSAAKDNAKLQETAKLIHQDWDAVRPKVVAKGGTKQAAAFEALVVKTDAAKTPADFARLATPILDEVDNLEKVFG